MNQYIKVHRYTSSVNQKINVDNFKRNNKIKVVMIDAVNQEVY